MSEWSSGDQQQWNDSLDDSKFGLRFNELMSGAGSAYESGFNGAKTDLNGG